MLKFYFSTRTCSLAVHIALEEAGVEYSPQEVSWERKLNLEELEKFNPLGAVPVLVSDSGKALTQNTAILEYIADLKPDSRLLAKVGSWERAETMSWVAFVSSDFQKVFGPIFQLERISSLDSTKADVRKFFTKIIQGNLEHIDRNLFDKEFITGPHFTIADAYLFTIIGWCAWVDISTAPYKNITKYMKRIYDRPAVQKVLKKEDLLDYLQN